MKPSPWIQLSIFAAVLAIAGSVAGLAWDRVYRDLTDNFRSQSIGQDVANLLICPLMIAVAVSASRGSLRAYLVWLGLLLYSVYTYLLYSFSVAFGPLFLLYVAVLGLSVYALAGGLLSLDFRLAGRALGKNASVRFPGILLIVIASMFALLWLSDIVPSIIGDELPETIAEVGTPTNPVHVIDLAMLLPLAFLSGLWLLREKDLGFVFAPVVLTGLSALALGIIALSIAANVRDGDDTIGVIVIIGVITLLQLAALWRLLRPVEARVALTPGVSGRR